MFGIGKALGKVFKTAKKVENRDLMEAIVGGCLLISAADGEIEKEETQRIERLLRNNENLQHFGGEIQKVIARFSELLETDFTIGKAKIMREIRDIQGRDQDVEDVMLNMLAVAKSDGEVEPQERKVFEEIARELGFRVDPDMYEVRKGA